MPLRRYALRSVELMAIQIFPGRWEVAWAPVRRAFCELVAELDVLRRCSQMRDFGFARMGSRGAEVAAP